ncbi:PQQ-binding-like beta-propeller repeat protein [Streptomyces coeruleoprunus]|uniref:PQQ-binding-like beta-propeller repeat protein n=1 Tax=Streptomyces coeruleoprunus TaxID=285563 RepID=A0ABV9XCM6_9ACTN
MPPLRSTGPVPEAEHPEYAGRYRLDAYLGSGGMGVVRLATSDSGLRLAVKVVHVEHAADPEFRARFRQEVNAARRVSGAFTAPVVDADPEAARPWMATLFIDGPTLSERVKRNGPLSAAELRRLGAGLAEALRDIHRAGVVHRDLKPSNVLLAADGPKVIDFGISRPADSDLRTETGKLIGTPPFMAPEQFQRPRDVGPAADVFAMGAVLVHAATGRGPFDSNSPYIVAYQVVHNEPDLAGVPEDLAPLLRRCLAKDPAARPTPDELMSALRAPEGHIPAQRGPVDGAVTAPVGPVGPVAREGVRRRRSPLVWVAALTAVAAAVVGGVVAVQGFGGDPSNGRRTSAEEAFRPWSVTLGGDRPPLCAAADAALYCSAPGVKAARLGLADGVRAWSVPSAGPAAPDAEATLVPAGGLLHAVGPGTASGGGARLEALDPESGAVRWGLDLGAYAQVLHSGDAALVVLADGRVRALDATTGTERWTKRPAARGAQWVAGGGVLFAASVAVDGSSTLVSAVDPAGGGVLWQKRVKGSLSPVQAVDGALVLLSADKDMYTDAVVRLDTADRGVRRVPLTAPADQAQAVVDGDVVYVVGSGGSLAAVGVGAGGAERWRLETGAARVSRPVVSEGRVFLTAGDGRLLVVDAGRGVLVGQTDPRMAGGRHTFAPLLPAPVVAGGRVYAAAPDGSVFGVDAGGW